MTSGTSSRLRPWPLLTWALILAGTVLGAEDTWDLSLSLWRATPVLLPLRGDAEVPAIWLRASGSGLAAFAAKKLAAPVHGSHLSVLLYRAGGGPDEVITLRAKSGTGHLFVSPPMPCPPDSWLSIAVPLCAAPPTPTEPTELVDLQLFDTNRSPHDLLIVSLEVSDQLSPAADRVLYPEQWVSRLEERRKAADGTPEAPVLELALARACAWAGDLARAEMLYGGLLAAQALTDAEPAMDLERAELTIEGRQPTDRIRALQAISAKYAGTPEAAWASLALAALSRQTGDVQQAVRMAGSVLNTFNTGPFAGMAMEEAARVRAAQGDFPAAADIWKQSLPLWTNTYDLVAGRERGRRFIADLLAPRGDATPNPAAAVWPAAALFLAPTSTDADLRRIQSEFADSLFAAPAAVKLGRSLKAANDTAGALAQYALTTKQYPFDTEACAQSRLYTAYALTDDTKRLAELQRAIVDYPDQPRVVGAAYLNIGIRQTAQGKRAEALGTLVQVAQARSGVGEFDLRACWLLAENYEALGETAAALEHWRRVASMAASRSGIAPFDEAGAQAREAIQRLAPSSATAPLPDTMRRP